MSTNEHLDLVLSEIDALPIAPDRPLIISDADEVILQFMAGLEKYLISQGFWIDLTSYAIHGNVKKTNEDTPIPNEHVTDLIKSFFRTHTETIEVVPAAPNVLRKLSDKSQIVILSNVPTASKDARIRCLSSQGVNYPVIANSGPKGPAVAALAARVEAPTFFLDDIPHHITSVAETAPDVRRIHFVADERLARLIEPAEHADHRIDDWHGLHDIIVDEINAFLGLSD